MFLFRCIGPGCFNRETDIAAIKIPIAHDAEADGKALFNEKDVESCVFLERVSNRKADLYVNLNVKMEAYYKFNDAKVEQ